MQCPSCKIPMIVQHQTCPQCGLDVHGKVPNSLLNILDDTQRKILYAFIATRGNVSKASGLLNLSRITTAGIMASIKISLLESASKQQNNAEAILFTKFCEEMEEEDKNE
ncbi:MAG: DUF2089 family protein [Candidatus Brocadiae bacterium]|nr:DUF2089 family protein [Candidatus Brocadiia bacterium]